MIKTHSKSSIYFITLDRVEKKNALNDEMVDELKLQFKHAFEDETIKIIVLEANGDVFSAGADLAYLQKLQQNSLAENAADSSSLAELFQMIYEGPKVVIAAVQGHAIAGGCGLATVCDFCFATEEAKFGYTEVRIGFIPAIVSYFLTRKIGETKSKELLLTGALISAEEAQKIGMINYVVKSDELKKEVEKFANQIALNCSAQALDKTKELIRTVQSLDTFTAMEYAAQMNAKARATEDCKKGINSFLNKEKVQW